MAIRRLREIFAVVHDENTDLSDIRDVYRELVRMKERFVLPLEFYRLLVSTVRRLGLEGVTVLTDVEEGVRKYRGEPILMEMLGMLYAESGYPLLGREQLNRVLKVASRESFSEQGWYDEEYARHVVDGIEENMPSLLRETDLSWPDDEEVACASERVRRATETGRFEEGLSVARVVLEKRPDQNDVRNNLARALWELGRWHEAITEQA